MELHRIAVRAVFAYVVLLGLLRASGKRTVGQSTPFAFVLALVIGDMVDDALWAEVAAAQFTVAVSTLTVTQILVAWAASRSAWVDRLVTGSPAPIVIDGTADRASLRATRMNGKSVAFELRHHGLGRGQWGDVKLAHVETSGDVSVLRTREARPIPKKDADAVRARARS